MYLALGLLLTIFLFKYHDLFTRNSKPEFRFNDIVATRTNWEHCYKHHLPETELETFRISAMELVDNLTPSGELLSQPRWKYGLRSDKTKDLVWFEEQALVRVTPSNPDWF